MSNTTTDPLARITDVQKPAPPDDRMTDVQVEHHNNIYLFRPMTTRAHAWVKEHLPLEDWQWFGGGFVVDHRMAPDVAEGMMASGLVVR